MKTTEITIKERFKHLDETKALDTKNRITLSHKVVTVFHKKHVNAFALYVGQDGDILLRPISYVPSKSLWSKKAILAVRKGVSEIKVGKMHKTSNLDNFFEQL